VFGRVVAGWTLDRITLGDAIVRVTIRTGDRDKNAIAPCLLS
jgi:hypothetical protein